jgi:hypothetical protein
VRSAHSIHLRVSPKCSQAVTVDLSNADRRRNWRISRPASDDRGGVIYCQFLTSQVTGLLDHARRAAGDAGHAIRIARRHITARLSPTAEQPGPVLGGAGRASFGYVLAGTADDKYYQFITSQLDK